MKKMLIILAIVVTMFCATTASSNCWNVVTWKYINPYVRHDFVDRNCDWNADIVQEYRMINGVWTATKWWWLP